MCRRPFSRTYHVGVMSRSACALAVVAMLTTAWLDAQGTYRVTRTAWGDPDLQGVWPGAVLVDVPFERPTSFGTRAELTDEEFAQAQRRAAADTSPAISQPPHWLER